METIHKNGKVQSQGHWRDAHSPPDDYAARARRDNAAAAQLDLSADVSIPETEDKKLEGKKTESLPQVRDIAESIHEPEADPSIDDVEPERPDVSFDECEPLVNRDVQNGVVNRDRDRDFIKANNVSINHEGENGVSINLPSSGRVSINSVSINSPVSVSIKYRDIITKALKPPSANECPVFRLARLLKAAHPGMKETEKGHVFQIWYIHAQKLKFDLAEFQACEAEFLSKWTAVSGRNLLLESFNIAKQKPLPFIPIQNKQILLLASLCREMQRDRVKFGEDRFSLSTYQPVPLFQVSNVTIWQWIRELIEKDVLLLVEKGTAGPGGRAARYRYMFPLEE